MKLLSMFSTNPFKRLNKTDRIIYITSLVVVTASFFLTKDFNILSLIASLVGVTGLIFVSKGDVFGQFVTVIFSVFYALVALKQNYYGEMITYLCMTAPIAGLSVWTWLKNPNKNGDNEVKVNHLTIPHIILIFVMAGVVTFGFYFVLKFFNTTNLLFSTISITTSFLASYLVMMRVSAYAIAYACNDIVVIVLWILASIEDVSYLPMVFCFAMFLINDIYGFYCWQKLKRKQRDENIASQIAETENA